MKVTSAFENSTVAKILELLDNATDKKTKTETAITKFSKIYSPVIIMAVLIMIFLPIVFNVNVKDKYFYIYIIFVSSSFSENASFTLMIGFLSTSPTIRDTIRKIQSFPRSIQ